jgi:hypothetical protein
MLSWCHVESTRTVSSQIDRLIDRQTDCPGISTRLWACEAGARPLEPCLQPVLLWLFWRKDPVYYAGQGFSYLKPLTHLVWCWFVINSLSWGMFLLFLVFQSFHHERMLNFVKGFFFLHLLRWSYGFFFDSVHVCMLNHSCNPVWNKLIMVDDLFNALVNLAY